MYLKSDDQEVAMVTLDLLFFSNQQNVYKLKASEAADTKASVLGEYVPAKLGMDEGETIVKTIVAKDYTGFLVFCFEI